MSDDQGIEAGAMEPMKVETAQEHDTEAAAGDEGNYAPLDKTFLQKLHDGMSAKLPRNYKLVTDEHSLTTSLYALRFSVMAAAINSKMLNPNYPLMVTAGAHPDSFDNTDPFDFNSATYFIPMCSMVGIAISSVVLGKVSDRLGRKRVLFALSWVGALGQVIKYFCRGTFWSFCAAQFAVGFFLGNLPVAMAYCGDVFSSKREKEAQLGIIVAMYVMGNSGGGIIAILMNGSGLFAPLWVGAAILLVSTLALSIYLIEPGDKRLLPIGKDSLLADEDEEDLVVRPERIDNCKLWNIVGGALLDNIGSTGLFPLCLSPLALNKYYSDMLAAGLTPILSVSGYQWLSVMVAFMVVPSTRITPFVFNKMGVAGTCVFGNLFTALVTFVLLMIGNGPTTEGSFGAFVAVMYGGYPFTVFSQLTTGPMLDLIATEETGGFVQGLNNCAMNFGMAFAPWMFGILADAAGTNIAIGTGIGVSLLAAMVNAPLCCVKEFQVQKKQPATKKILAFEDPELVQKALAGEYIPREALFEINYERVSKGKPMLIPDVKPYSDDKETGLAQIYKRGGEDFRFHMTRSDAVLAEANDPKADLTMDQLCEILNNVKHASDDTVEKATGDLGKWVGDYLRDSGYNPHTSSMLLKQMVLAAFPPIMVDRDYSPDNIEESLLGLRRVMNAYVNQAEKGHTFTSMLGTGSTNQNFY